MTNSGEAQSRYLADMYPSLLLVIPHNIYRLSWSLLYLHVVAWLNSLRFKTKQNKAKQSKKKKKAIEKLYLLLELIGWGYDEMSKK